MTDDNRDECEAAWREYKLAANGVTWADPVPPYWRECWSAATERAAKIVEKDCDGWHGNCDDDVDNCTIAAAIRGR